MKNTTLSAYALESSQFVLDCASKREHINRILLLLGKLVPVHRTTEELQKLTSREQRRAFKSARARRRELLQVKNWTNSYAVLPENRRTIESTLYKEIGKFTSGKTVLPLEDKEFVVNRLIAIADILLESQTTSLLNTL